MIKILKDITSLVFFSLIKKEKIFFCENSYALEYLRPIIDKQLNKNKNKKLFIISYKKINLDKKKFYEIYFNYNFFFELFFLILNSKYVYSTTPGLGTNYFKRSLIKKSLKYIYIQHSNISLTMGYHHNAFINFDAVQAVNSYQYNEAKLIRHRYQKKFKIFKSQYLFLKNYNYYNNSAPKSIDFLIAPTWNTNFFTQGLYFKIIKEIKKNNFSYILRPHPMSFKKKEISFQELKEKNIFYDINSRAELKKFRFLISDWSGIFLEFFLVNGIKSILFDTKPKILNQNFEHYKKKPIEIDLRKDISLTYNNDSYGEFIELLNLIKDKKFDKLEISDFVIKKCKLIFYDK